MTSAEYWSAHHVDAPAGGFATVEASLEHYAWRNSQYPGTLDLLPVTGADGLVVLDYGCGPGNDTIGFGTYSAPARLIAMDVSPAAIDLARARAALHGIAVEFVQVAETPAKLPLPDACVDLVHSAGVLHHTPDPAAILREFRRVLRPGGAAQVMVYNRDSIWMHLHVAYEMSLEYGLYAGATKEEAFARTTDGDLCPIARCYRPSEFLELAAGAGLDARFSGAAVSLFELSKLQKLYPALRDRRLDLESRDFLSSLTFDERNWPRHAGRVAGINGCYRLSRDQAPP